MRASRLSLSVLSAGAVVVALSACSSTAGEDEFALVADGTFTVCTNPSYKPFEFSQDGKTVGFDIDLAREIADDMGLELALISAPFEGIESGSALDTRQCDAGITGMSINDERAERMTLSDPYFEDGLGLLVGADADIASVDDLGDSPVGVQQATTGEEYATEQGLNVVQFEESDLALQGLQTGQVDAVINNLAVLGAAVAGDDSLTIAQEFDTEQYAVAVRKGNTELIEKVNATIERINSDGTYDQLVDTWLS
ncbi:transporter substrate-binding domain-containing protein [Mycetocola reblochoni]|uniref:Glutamine ABC transporter, periplasmic glutamine-binding protein (TC 3.A.1.3.2) n=2 Tax=Mycetocola reblochoni TaxID=331618 RepID=A0A1R4II70_9MICO|nr:transporter substrate-binding domain-containing protein [Mycetocola reblochoni]RLP69653.1 amino acid ABC transporter substrate-binding protein [Mycetocola reblochoni]SJN19481.1 Glutamine ABC transporter, periplasmic glutamine-binding protein (TC 3.A.1.3.2) [Mycetocola reblochoni REB411]